MNRVQHWTFDRRSRACIAVALGVALAGMFIPAAHANPAASPVLQELESAFIRLHEDVRPAVVNIDAQGPMRTTRAIPEGMEELWRFFGFGPPTPFQEQQPMRPPVSSGSGFIYDKQGHIITNNHVIENAEKLTVRLDDGTEIEAEIVGTDPDTDVAVIKIDPEGRDLPVAVMGDSDSVRVGQFAIAVGSPRGLEGSLSFGHISALGRDYELRSLPMRFRNFIQTDAAINLGNSGGPLCNIYGEVVGINTAIMIGAQSLGFAIPINTAKSVVPELIAKGKVTRGYLGVEIREVGDMVDSLQAPDSDGAYVNNVTEGTAAARYGVRVHDIIRKVNGETIRTPNDLINVISKESPGARVVIEVWRDGASREVEVVLDEYPGSVERALQEAPVLGMRVRPLTGELAERMGLDAGTTGVVVAEVEPGSPAALANIAPGDVVLEVNREKVTSVSQWRQLMRNHAEPGRTLLIRTVRGTERPTTRVLRVPEDADIR